MNPSFRKPAPKRPPCFLDHHPESGRIFTLTVDAERLDGEIPQQKTRQTMDDCRIGRIPGEKVKNEACGQASDARAPIRRNCAPLNPVSSTSNWELWFSLDARLPIQG
jgi:hypothetical protein